MVTKNVYGIKEAAQELGTETHVLRFWEEELALQIERNAQGRRVYTEEDMQTFREVMKWKEQGLALKEIKAFLHGDGKSSERRIIVYRPRGEKDMEERNVEVKKNELQQDAVWKEGKEEKARRFQELLKQFISESIRESNAELLEAVKEGIFKELDYQFRQQEERELEREKARTEKEDAHFKQLDENLRNAIDKRGKKKKKGIWKKEKGAFSGR